MIDAIVGDVSWLQVPSSRPPLSMPPTHRQPLGRRAQVSTLARRSHARCDVRSQPSHHADTRADAVGMRVGRTLWREHAPRALRRQHRSRSRCLRLTTRTATATAIAHQGRSCPTPLRTAAGVAGGLTLIDVVLLLETRRRETETQAVSAQERGWRGVGGAGGGAG